MKIRTLVADDEFIICQGIQKFVDSHPDFSVVAVAEDGEIALEKAKEQEIDVFFVDINMPFLNGFEFIRALQENQPDAVIVIITGYDKFEYAREALKLGVFEYLLKPIMEEPFYEMLEKVKGRVLAREQENKYLAWAAMTLESNKQYLIGDLLKNALTGHLTSEELLFRGEYLGLDLPAAFTLTLIATDYVGERDVRGEWDEDLLYFMTENVAREVFGAAGQMSSCRDDFGNLVILSAPLAGEKEIMAFREVVENHAPVNCEVVQAGGDGISALQNAYAEATARLDELQGESTLIKALKADIEENYGRVDYALKDAAAAVGFSEPYISRVFSKETGSTFSDYLAAVRIRRAIALLADDRLKIYEVAEAVGYASQHYFPTSLKKSWVSAPRNIAKRINDKCNAAAVPFGRRFFR